MIACQALLPEAHEDKSYILGCSCDPAIPVRAHAASSVHVSVENIMNTAVTPNNRKTWPLQETYSLSKNMTARNTANNYDFFGRFICLAFLFPMDDSDAATLDN